MTAEIAIMNKEAIALAADSAITTTGESGQKIFTSANKLFALSKYYPIGIMIYGSANLMGVPWETIIKIYRDKLAKIKFNTLEEYAKNFMQFLDNGNPLFPESTQEEYVRNSIYSYLNFIKGQIKEKVHSEIDEKGKVTHEEVCTIVSETIKEHYERWQRASNVPSIPKSFNNDIIAKYRQLINTAIQEILEKIPISRTSHGQLNKR